MSNIAESRTEIQIDVPMTEDDKIKCSDEMVSAMSAVQGAHSDIKDFVEEKKEEIGKFNQVIGNARSKLSDRQISKESRLALTNEIIEALNAISRANEMLESYKQEKKSEILKLESAINVCRIKLDRGRDFKWVEVNMLKDFDKKLKTFIDLKTGEIIKKIPMSDEEMQMEFRDEGLSVKRVN